MATSDLLIWVLKYKHVIPRVGWREARYGCCDCLSYLGVPNRLGGHLSLRHRDDRTVGQSLQKPTDGT